MNITNNIITSFIDTLYKNDNKDLQELREFAERKHVPIILRDTEGLLLKLLKIKKPQRILEIGAAVGYSACCFAECCDCHVISIESNAETFEIARNNIENMGFADRVEVRFGDARDVLMQMSNEACTQKAAGNDTEDTDADTLGFDAVFIDAAKSHYKAFWDLALPLCNDEAMIICDNVLMKGMTASDEYDTGKRYKTSIRRMREFISYITDLPYADTCILPVGDGISISVIDKGKYSQI